jgi:diacylglycerol kinase
MSSPNSRRAAPPTTPTRPQTLVVAFFYTVHGVAKALLPAADFGQLHVLLALFVPASLMVAFSKVSSSMDGGGGDATWPP